MAIPTLPESHKDIAIYSDKPSKSSKNTLLVFSARACEKICAVTVGLGGKSEVECRSARSKYVESGNPAPAHADGGNVRCLTALDAFRKSP
jgi:hypothetical protein